MQVDVRREVVLEAVARVHAANVRAQRALQTARIVIVVEKIVVAESVGSKRGIVAPGANARGAPLRQRPSIFAASTSSSGVVLFARR